MVLDAEEADYGELEVYDWGRMIPADRDSDVPSSIGGRDDYVDRVGGASPRCEIRRTTCCAKSTSIGTSSQIWDTTAAGPWPGYPASHQSPSSEGG